jgi:imidazolonepropionase
MRDLEVLSDAAVLIDDDGRIAGVGPYAELRDSARAERRAPSAEARVVVEEVKGVLFPGFVDAHTHAMFGGPRLDDHERRALGMDYKRIAAEGGGILSSVRDFRQRSREELVDLTRWRLAHLLANGATTVEVKSGYGLETGAELLALEVIGAVAASGGPDVVATFLGAHEVPEEHRARRGEYLRIVIEEMLPAVARQGIARFCDVFCEPGVYTAAEARRVLEAARSHELGLKLHADELDPSGGAELAVQLGAVSADHLAAVSERGIVALGQSDTTVAVLLPGTMLFLGRKVQAPARRLLEAGAAVALATDFNPGSAPGMSLPLMATLGVSQLGMRHAEAVTAITVNGAAALGLADDRGQLAPGFRADLTLVEADDWRELAYWYGTNLVTRTWVAGVAC